MNPRVSVVYLFVLAMFFPMAASAQSTVVTCGESISNATYKLSYSIGQVAVLFSHTREYSVSEGVIQPLNVVEISETEVKQMFHVKVYPNPTTSVVSLESDNLEAETPIRLYSFDGKLLESKTWVGERLSFNLMNKKTGVYLLHVKDRTFKIIKK